MKYIGLSLGGCLTSIMRGEVSEDDVMFIVTRTNCPDFDCIFEYLKKVGNVPKRLICFTDGYPCGSWGDANYCDTTWIIHGDPNPNPPFGTYAIYDER